MAYTKQTWVDGVTPIDAEHLNHMEDGIEENSIIHSLPLVKGYNHGSFVIDETVDEIRDAFANGLPVYVLYGNVQFDIRDYQCRGTQYGRVTFVGNTQGNSGEYLDVVIVHWETIPESEEFHNELYLYGGQYNILTRVEAF